MADQHPYEWAVSGPPVGIWQTAEGSFSNVMGARLTIRADGTGMVQRYGMFSGDDGREIMWKFTTPGRLCIYEPSAEFPDPEAELDWDRFSYRADWSMSDIGTSPVLVNDGVEDGWLKAAGFWQFDGPIQLFSRA